MAEYTSDQLALERQMAERGEAREHAQYSAALERDALPPPKPGRALLRQLVGATLRRGAPPAYRDRRVLRHRTHTGGRVAFRACGA